MKYRVWNQTSGNNCKKSVENYTSNLKLKWNQQKKPHWYWWTLAFHKALCHVSDGTKYECPYTPLTSYYTEPGCFLTQLWDFYQEVKTIEYTHVLEEPEQDLEILSQFWHFPHPVFTPTQPCSDAATLTAQLHKTHGEHCVSHACSTLPAQPLQVLNERWWANRASPLTVTRQELRRHSYHSSSYQGHKSSVGPRECSYHCQLMSSKEASSKASRFIQELFCFDKVRVLFFCFLLFFFLKNKTEVVCISPWHLPSKWLHQKIPDQP